MLALGGDNRLGSLKAGNGVALRILGICRRDAEEANEN